MAGQRRGERFGHRRGHGGPRPKLAASLGRLTVNIARIGTRRGDTLAALVVGLSCVATWACGGGVDSGSAGGGAATGGASTSEGDSGGVSTGARAVVVGGRAEGGLTGTAGDEEGGGGAMASGGSATGGSGGTVSPGGGAPEPSSGGTSAGTMGGAPEPSSGGASAGTMGGSAGADVADGGTAQAGATSATGAAGGGGLNGGVRGLGGVASDAGSESGIGGVDCTLVGCALTWCGEPCESPCGCCPCLGASVDAEGNRCQDGCWLRTAGDAHCRLPWDRGSCDDAVPRFWFDAATNRCELRTYGGCEGNANRFDSLDFCEQDCAQITGSSEEPLPVVYAFGDRCRGDTLTEAGRGIVTEFVGARSHEPPAVDPYLLVDLMAGSGLCVRPSDIVLEGAGVAAFVDYYEFGETGYLPVHRQQIPTDAITTELSELSVALGVEPPQVVWR